MREYQKNSEYDKPPKERFDNEGLDDGKPYEEKIQLNRTRWKIRELKKSVREGNRDVLQNNNHFKNTVVSVSEEQMPEMNKNPEMQQLFAHLKTVKESNFSPSLAVTETEYQQALQDEKKARAVVQKFDEMLDMIYQEMHGGPTFHGNPFGTYTSLFYQEVIPTHDAIIDLKQPLLSST